MRAIRLLGLYFCDIYGRCRGQLRCVWAIYRALLSLFTVFRAGSPWTSRRADVDVDACGFFGSTTEQSIFVGFGVGGRPGIRVVLQEPTKRLFRGFCRLLCCRLVDACQRESRFLIMLGKVFDMSNLRTISINFWQSFFLELPENHRYQSRTEKLFLDIDLRLKSSFWRRCLNFLKVQRDNLPVQQFPALATSPDASEDDPGQLFSPLPISTCQN